MSPELIQLDIADGASVSAAADELRARHGGVDIVIQNAAARITRETPQADQVARFIDTNNHGTLRVIEAFVPLLRDNARFIVVASSFGSLRHLDPRLHARFDSPGLTLDDIERAVDEFAAATRAGTARDAGWPDWINVPSKIGQVASVRILARDRSEEFRRRGYPCERRLSRPRGYGSLTAVVRRHVEGGDPGRGGAGSRLAGDPARAGREEPFGVLVRHRKPHPWN